MDKIISAHGIGAIIGKCHEDKTVAALSVAQALEERWKNCGPAPVVQRALRGGDAIIMRAHNHSVALPGPQLANDIGRVRASHLLLNEGISIAPGVTEQLLQPGGASSVGLWNGFHSFQDHALFRRSKLDLLRQRSPA